MQLTDNFTLFIESKLGCGISERQLKRHGNLLGNKAQITFFHRLTSLLLLSQNGHHTGDVLLDCFDAAGVLQLVDGMLEAQVKQLGLQVCQLAGQLCGLHLARLCAWQCTSCPLSANLWSVTWAH